MLDGYHKIFNRFGLKEVDRGVDIPEPQLGIGWAEELAPLPLAFDYGSQKKPTVQKIRSIDQVAVNGQGNPVKLDQFPQTGYMGEALGGF